jgi:ribosome recycling factor
MIDEILADVKGEMDNTIVSFKRDLARIRAGRAAPSLLDSLMVEYYGASTSLKQLATVSAPESRLLVIQPFDLTASASIEKAIRVSNLGLSPINDGKIIRVPIPDLTEDRRKDLVKQVRKEAENHRISARSHRRDANEMLKQAESDNEIGEDECRGAQEIVQKLTDAVNVQIDAIAKAKEAEVLEV